MMIKITSDRQVTLPKRVLDTLGVGPGDHIKIIEGQDGFILKPSRIDHSRLGTLKDKLQRGHGTFDIHTFREQPSDPSHRG